MDIVIQRLNFYIIPPLLSFIIGWTLATLMLIKGKFTIENILFSLVCIWWTLMSPIFISHQLLRGDIETIMKIERTIHFIYVYLPLITLLYLYKAFALKNKILIIVTAVVSFISSLATMTPYYFSGIYTYSWGYSAKGGIAFMIFGAYGFFVTMYCLYFFFKKLRSSSNQTEKLKLKYIFLSFVSTSLLTIMNIPAISGFDFYPFGNFMFIPLSLLAFGVLKYRLMDIRSVLHVTFIWMVTSSLVLVPNAILFYAVRSHVENIGDALLFLLLLIWFLINYIYLKYTQPLIDRFFNKQKFNLIILERDFIDGVSHLRSMEDLSSEFTGIIKKALNVKWADLYIKDKEERLYINSEKKIFQIQPGIEDWISVMDHIVESDMVKTNPYYNNVREDLISIFTEHGCQYIVPLVQNNELMGLVFVSERYNLRQLNSAEIKFINGIRSTVSISLSNSILYQDLTDLKDKLEDKVLQRTEDLLRIMEKSETINAELSRTNRELEEAKKIAELDMAMAVHVQKSLFPRDIPQSDDWDIALEFHPISGVSGDIYDFYTEKNRLLGLSILDVSGHGVASGLITMIARSVIHRYFFRLRTSKLSVILNEANRELIDEISASNKYLTGIILRFDGNIVEYVNAGHPDLLIKKATTGNARLVNLKDKDFKGTFLGVDGMDSSFNMIKFIVEPGDLLVGFTDCIVEGQNESERPYGMNRIVQSLASAPSGSAKEVLGILMDDFSKHLGNSPLADDLTIIVARKK